MITVQNESVELKILEGRSWRGEKLNRKPIGMAT